MKSGIQTIISHSEDETLKLGETIASQIKTDIFIPVIGPLGVGKSVLIRGIIRGLGYEGRVQSPSYTIERVYTVADLEIHHWDLYRLEKTGEIERVFDEIRSQSGIRLVEWGERLSEYLPDEMPIIEMLYSDDYTYRIVKIDSSLAEIEEELDSC